MEDAIKEELEYLRKLAADDALRAIQNLRRSLDISEEEIRRGMDGEAMRTNWCIPNHQYLHEVVEAPARFTALWNACGLVRS